MVESDPLFVTWTVFRELGNDMNNDVIMADAEDGDHRFVMTALRQFVPQFSTDFIRRAGINICWSILRPGVLAAEVEFDEDGDLVMTDVEGF
jgi:hypothetical protein